jgi:hypothetical protein
MLLKIYICVVFSVLIFQAGFSQDSVKVTNLAPMPKLARNNWSLNFMYTDKGFGLGSNLYRSISNTVDVSAGIMISGVKDPNEFEQFDIFGNSYVPDKINRIYMISINVGMQKYIFSDELDESFRPLLSFGISPSLVLTDPYDKDFFKAFGYMNAGFAFGGYAGIGMEYKESNSVSLSINIRYSYIPVLINDIRSLKDKTISDVGGIQLVFGLNFLK